MHLNNEGGSEGETKDDHRCHVAAPKVCVTIRDKARMRLPGLGPYLGA